MAISTHAALVSGQFGAHAAAYVSSAAHATGPDLDLIAQTLHGQNRARVLDLGCGGGHASFAAAPQVGRVVAYDLAAEMVAAEKSSAASSGRATSSVTRPPPFASWPSPTFNGRR